MGELWSYLKDRYSKASGRSAVIDSIAKQRVKNDLIAVCEEHIHNAGEKLTVEVSDKDLPYVLAVIDEEPLKSRYNIIQTGSSLLCISPKEIEVSDIF